MKLIRSSLTATFLVVCLLVQSLEANSGAEAVVSAENAPESNIHAAINPTDSANIVMTFMRNLGQSVAFPVMTSTDFGVSWQASAFDPASTLPNATVRAAADPVMAFDANGRVYFSWNYAYTTPDAPTVPKIGFFYAHSDDGGINWQAETNSPILSAPNVFTLLYDEQWITADQSNSAYRNNLYLVCTERSEGISSDISRILFLRKPAGAEFEAEAKQLSDPSLEISRTANIIVDAQGTLHVVYFGTESEASGEWSLWYRASDDGGDTFSAQRKLIDVQLPGWSKSMAGEEVPGVITQPAATFALDRSGGSYDGNLYLSWNAGGVSANDGNGMDIFFMRSADDGANWSDPIVVNKDTRGLSRHQFIPAPSVNRQGVVSVGWYDGRAADGNTAVDFYVAHSFDGGKSFTDAKKLSTESADFTKVAVANGGFGVGRYTTVISGNTNIQAFWSDGRSNNGNINVYAACLTPENTSTGIGLAAPRGESPIRDMRFDASGGELGLMVTTAKPGPAAIGLFDLRGRRHAQFAIDYLAAGQHRLNLHTGTLSPGVYIVRLRTTTAIHAEPVISLP